RTSSDPTVSVRCGQGTKCPCRPSCHPPRPCLAASSFSLTNGPVHDAHQPLDVDKHALRYGCLVALGMNLLGGANVSRLRNGPCVTNQPDQPRCLALASQREEQAVRPGQVWTDHGALRACSRLGRRLLRL